MVYKEWLKEWLELYVKPSTKERTYMKYRRQVEKYSPRARGLRGGRAVRGRIAKILRDVTERGMAASTVNGVLFVLKSSLKKAVALGIAHRQFTDAIVSPKAREKKVVCFNKDEQKKIERYVLEHNMPYFFGIALSLYTGLRNG